MTTTPVITRKTCGTCKHFKERDPVEPWPRAGVARTAEGRCHVRSADPLRQRWRRKSDWCNQHERAKR